MLADVGDRTLALAAAVAGQDAVVHLAAKVDVVGPWREYAADERRRHAPVGRRRPRGRGRPARARVVAVGRARRATRWSASAPDRPTRTRARGHYARSKALAEREVLAGVPERATRRQERQLAGRMRIAVVRAPHLVWGPGDTQLVGRIVARARAGRLAVVGTGAALIDTTYVDNAVDALVAALDRAPDLHGEALVVSNGEPRPVAELLAAICAAAGVPAPRLAVPVGLARAAGRRRGSGGARGRRPADDAVPRRAAVHRALVRPARDPRGAGLDPAGRPGRGLPEALEGWAAGS